MSSCIADIFRLGGMHYNVSSSQTDGLQNDHRVGSTLSSQKLYILNFTEKRLPYRVEPHLVSLLFVLILQASDNLIFALYYQFFVFAVSVIPICAIELKI